jgi:hypothetical protein
MLLHYGKNLQGKEVVFQGETLFACGCRQFLAWDKGVTKRTAQKHLRQSEKTVCLMCRKFNMVGKQC